MTNSNYTNSIQVNRSAEIVFDALTNKIHKWWSESFEGTANAEGAVFTVRFGTTFKTFEVEELVPNTKIVWRCQAAHLDHPEIKATDEWKNTAIVWTLVPNDFSVKVSLLHEGLNREMECFGVCEKGWNGFIASLFAFLEGGDGLPYRPKV